MKIPMPAAIIFCGLLNVINPTFAQTWTQTSAPSNQWRSVACSADGVKLAACTTLNGFTNGGAIYISTNSGFTWIISAAPTNFGWLSIASSANGSNFVAGSWNGPIYTSTNSGNTWTSNSVPLSTWLSVSSSADGTKLAAVASNGGVYTSTNSGAEWTQTGAPTNFWHSIACSADGKKLVAVAVNFQSNGLIYTSTNFGVAWSLIDRPAGISFSSTAQVACSADGNSLAIDGGTSSFIHTSKDFGATWMSNSVPNQVWYAVASSIDGVKIIACGSGGIYASTNSGGTWVQTDALGEYWPSICSSADGNKLTATAGVFAVGGGRIYAAYSTPTPQLNLMSASSNLLLSWIMPSTNFVLQQNSDLNATDWMTLTNSPTLNLSNLCDEVTLSPTNSSGFFRLITQ